MALTLVTAFPFLGQMSIWQGRKAQLYMCVWGGEGLCVRGVANAKKSGLGEHGDPQDREE